MKRFFSGVLFLSVLFAGAAQAHAKDGELLNQQQFEVRARKAEALSERVRRVSTYNDKFGKKMQVAHGATWERRGPTVYIPELDPKAAGAAVALLIGGAFVLVERRKRVAI